MDDAVTQAARLGERVAAARVASGLTQPDLARLAGVNPRRVAALEAGSLDVYLCEIDKIAGRLNLDLLRLLRP